MFHITCKLIRDPRGGGGGYGGVMKRGIIWPDHQKCVAGLKIVLSQAQNVAAKSVRY